MLKKIKKKEKLINNIYRIVCIASVIRIKNLFTTGAEINKELIKKDMLFHSLKLIQF